MAPKSSNKGKDENTQMFWFPEPTEGYALGEVLLEDTQQNMQVKLHLQDGTNKVRAVCRRRGLRTSAPSAPRLRAARACYTPAAMRQEECWRAGDDQSLSMCRRVTFL